MGELSIGVVGLGVMGRNLTLNLEEHGFSVGVWDAWPDPVNRFIAATTGKNIRGYHDIGRFVLDLERPRRIILLVKAGEVVDATIAAIEPFLSPGDVLVDGGNERYTNTERRAARLSEKGILYFGMGVSGGESGARHGPSLMPGGSPEGYAALAPILTKVAAQHADGPCVTYVGPGGSGHYVKMVHNGIEYGDMQLIAEAYDVLKTLGGLSNDELADVFDEWNRGELESYLIEITARIFRFRDPEGKGDLVDQIVDATAQKGTGKWTVEEATEMGVPVPTIAVSVDARALSSARPARLRASTILPGPAPNILLGQPKATLVANVRAALYVAKACSYAQGFDMLQRASEAHGWGLKLGELARIWQAGCIIRARFLGRIKAAYDRDPALDNLLLDPYFREEIGPRQDGFRAVVAAAAQAGLAVLGFGVSLGYYDTIRRARLPANLTQAQRDFFGAHTYRRLDRDGDFHTDWSGEP